MRVAVRFTERQGCNTASASSNGGSMMVFNKGKKVISKSYFQKAELGAV